MKKQVMDAILAMVFSVFHIYIVLLTIYFSVQYNYLWKLVRIHKPTDARLCLSTNLILVLHFNWKKMFSLSLDFLNDSKTSDLIIFKCCLIESMIVIWLNLWFLFDFRCDISFILIFWYPDRLETSRRAYWSNIG